MWVSGVACTTPAPAIPSPPNSCPNSPFSKILLCGHRSRGLNDALSCQASAESTCVVKLPSQVDSTQYTGSSPASTAHSACTVFYKYFMDSFRHIL